MSKPSVYVGPDMLLAQTSKCPTCGKKLDGAICFKTAPGDEQLVGGQFFRRGKGVVSRFKKLADAAGFRAIHVTAPVADSSPRVPAQMMPRERPGEAFSGAQQGLCSFRGLALLSEAEEFLGGHAVGNHR